MLSSLTATLKHHIAYKCTVHKYRPNTDLRPVLAQALWRIRSYTHTSNSQESKPTSEMIAPQESNPNSGTKYLRDLNVQVHSQIKAMLAKDAVSPIDHDSIDIDGLIEEMDPKLWEAVTLLTQSTSERRGTSTVTEPTSSAYQVKRIRRLFLLCSLMFITDDRCSVPLHILVADLVESQGGSALLHKMLNRLGVCASVDTLSRFMQHKVRAFSDTADRYISTDSFTVVSADNVDFLHTYARVVKGKQNSSWHGTTVQAVQPLPSLSLHLGSSTSMSVDLPTAHPQSYTHAGSLSSLDASLFTGPRALGDSRSPSTSTGVDLPTGHPQSYTHAGSLVNINRWQDEGVEDIMDWVFGDEADHGEDAQAELAGDIDNELSD